MKIEALNKFAPGQFRAAKQPFNFEQYLAGIGQK